jgi:hypothetical protein
MGPGVAYPSDWCNCCGSDCGWTLQAEYLMWWTRPRNLPPLVTTSPDGTPRAEAGRLGFDDTEILFGGGPIGTRFRSGARVTASKSLDQAGCWHADARFWGVEDGGITYFNESDGSPILGRPFFNVVLAQEDAQLIAFPGVTTDGSVRVDIDNDLFGADAALRKLVWQDCSSQVYLLGGYQFTRLDDSLLVNNIQTSIDEQSALTPGTVLDVQDSFRTQNEFHGGQIGFLASASTGCWDVSLAARIALGGIRERVVIDGRTLTTPPGGATATSPRGLLAQPSNIGDYERSRVTFLPQFDLTARYHTCSGIVLSLGYSFLYWNDAVLAGNQIDRAINLSQLPGPVVGELRPLFHFQRSDYWAMGLNFGVEYSF